MASIETDKPDKDGSKRNVYESRRADWRAYPEEKWRDACDLESDMRTSTEQRNIRSGPHNRDDYGRRDRTMTSGNEHCIQRATERSSGHGGWRNENRDISGGVMSSVAEDWGGREGEIWTQRTTDSSSDHGGGRNRGTQYAKVFGPSTAADGPRTVVRGPTAAFVGPRTFATGGRKRGEVEKSSGVEEWRETDVEMNQRTMKTSSEHAGWRDSEGEIRQIQIEQCFGNKSWRERARDLSEREKEKETRSGREDWRGREKVMSTQSSGSKVWRERGRERTTSRVEYGRSGSNGGNSTKEGSLGQDPDLLHGEEQTKNGSGSPDNGRDSEERNVNFQFRGGFGRGSGDRLDQSVTRGNLLRKAASETGRSESGSGRDFRIGENRNLIENYRIQDTYKRGRERQGGGFRGHFVKGSRRSSGKSDQSPKYEERHFVRTNNNSAEPEENNESEKNDQSSEGNLKTDSIIERENSCADSQVSFEKDGVIGTTEFAMFSLSQYSTDETVLTMDATGRDQPNESRDNVNTSTDEQACSSASKKETEVTASRRHQTSARLVDQARYTHGGFSIVRLQDVADPRDLLQQLTVNIEGLTQFLNTTVMAPDDTRKILRITNTVIEIKDPDRREDVTGILQVLCTTRFLDAHLILFIQLTTSSAQTTNSADSTIVGDIESIQQFITSVCHKLPSQASKCSLLLTYLLHTHKLMSVLREHNPSLEEDLRTLQEECDRTTGRVLNQARITAPRRCAGPDDDDAHPPDDFSLMSIIPEERDLDWTQRPFLRANKAVGVFRDQDHYLDVQFRLLREDVVRPIREGIREYRRMEHSTGKRCKDLRMYYKVQIVHMVCGDTVEHVLHFDTTQTKRIEWQHSKRLLFGCLLCLSNDDFETLLFAVVTNRDSHKLENGIISVSFENGLDVIQHMKPGDTMTMAETPTFFEAYRHVLQALQQMKRKPLPMVRHIVLCQTDVNPPKYLLRGTALVELKLNSFLRSDSFFDASSVQALELSNWPPLEETGFDASQLEAIQAALTNELAIIQGPPGTGKTFLGLQIARVLLDNRSLWADKRDPRPMLVVCYTNHALDQFLGGILKICPNDVIRVGSRGKNPSLEQFNLKEVKKRKNRTVSAAMIECRKKLTYLKEKLERYRQCMENTVVLGTNALKKCTLPGQWESLTDICDGVFRDSLQGLTIDWLAFGAVLTDQEGTTDPYILLAQEVTSHILGGSDTCTEQDIQFSDVHDLPYDVRAKLYRGWISRMGGHVSHRSLVLSDEELRPFMDQKLYQSITAPLLTRHSHETDFCIRAWLGVQASSRDAVEKNNQRRVHS